VLKNTYICVCVYIHVCVCVCVCITWGRGRRCASVLKIYLAGSRKSRVWGEISKRRYCSGFRG